MKQLVFVISLATFFFFTLLSSNIFAQNYNNEWIDYDKTYFRIKVDEKGIHRVPFDLISENFSEIENLSGVGFKLMSMGAEIPIFVTNDGSFSDGDFIEFYGEKNNGLFDTQLFMEEDHQIDRDVSLFTDTRAYYLTYDLEAENLRINSAENTPNDQVALEYFWRTKKQSFLQDHKNGKPDAKLPIGQVYFPGFGENEGFGSVLVTPNSDYEFPLFTPNIYESDLNATIEIKLLGDSDDLYIDNGDHHVRMLFNGNDFEGNELIYEGFESEIINSEIPMENLGEINTLQLFSLADIINQEAYEDGLDEGISIYPLYPFGPDRNSLAYISVRYPHTFNFASDLAEFTLDNQNESYINFPYESSVGEVIIYDLSNKQRIIPDQNGQSFDLYLGQGEEVDSDRDFYFATEMAIEIVEQLSQINFTNFSNPENHGDYVLIYHPVLTEGAVNEVESYADYRESFFGGSYNVQSVDINQLYDQFAYGIRTHPLSIQNFTNFMLDTHPNTDFQVFLLGKGIRYNLCRFNPQNFEANLIPTFGSVSSDFEMLSRNKNERINQVPIGRLGATTPEEIRIYLDKVIMYEQVLDYGCGNPPVDWLNQTLQVVSGSIEDQTENYNEIAESFYQNYEEAEWQYEPYFIENTGQTTYNASAIEKINAGIGVLNFIGNASTTIWTNTIDINEWENEGKYPFVINTSYFSGQIFSPTQNSVSNDLVFAEDKGAIAHIGGNYFFSDSCAQLYNQLLYENILVDNYGETLGEIIRATNLDVINHEGSCDENLSADFLLTNYLYHGDPALKLPGKAFRDLELLQNSFSSLDSISSEAENFEISFEIEGLEDFAGNEIEIVLAKLGLESLEIIYIDTLLADSTDNFLFTIPTEALDNGGNDLNLVVNRFFSIGEYCNTNNDVSFSVFREFDEIMNDIQLNSFDNHIKIFPNPAKSKLYVSSHDEIESISLYSSKGNLLKVLKGLNSPTVEMDLSHYPPGIYYVEIFGRNSIVRKKVSCVK